MGTAEQDAYLKNFGLDVNDYVPPSASAGEDQSAPEQPMNGVDGSPADAAGAATDGPPPAEAVVPPDQQTNGHDASPPDREGAVANEPDGEAEPRAEPAA